MFTNTKPIFDYAIKNNRAICAFNVSNLEMIQAVCEGAQNANVPVIISASESAIKYAGAKNLVLIVKNIAKSLSVPVALHLDHGANFEICKQAITAGFTSVMIDGSALSFEENIALTKRVVELAHKKNVTVEAELGKIVGVEDNVSSHTAILTDPAQAKKFVKATGCDSLAISIGTAHGVNKGSKTPKIYYDTINNVSVALGKNYPLVAHGSSSVPKNLIDQINNFGGNIAQSQGISETDLIKMSRSPICKINMDTDLRLAFTAELRKFLAENPTVFDPRKIIGATRTALTAQITKMLSALSK